MDYPWYKFIDGDDDSIHQGDLIPNCPLLIPPSNINQIQDEEIEIDVKEVNVIIMSQSCDLLFGKLSIVQVCPYFPINEIGFIRDAHPNDKEPRKEKMRQGILPGYHLLNKPSIENFENDFVAVDFRHIYGVAYDFIIEYVAQMDERIRLLPPYREQLSQAFARYFMRVGLPVDIPKFNND